jgi:DNA-binding transcriptional ArsR family regulator
MSTVAALAETASLIGEPARAAMLAALLDGRALSAGELAEAAGITPHTENARLPGLFEAGLLAQARQGRHRYHRLAGPGVARLLEGLLDLAAAAPRRVATGPRDAALRRARTCYDHLAGRLGVALADALAARGAIELDADAAAVTPEGEGFLAGFGIAPPARRGRLSCRPCLDWSERRPHLAGVLGAALCARCLDLGWIRRRAGSRALEITPAGLLGFATTFAIPAERLGLP